MATADTAVVTGASSGIGEAIAAALLDRGIPVVTLQRNAPKLKHRDLHFRPIDLTDLAATRKVANDVAAEFPVRYLVNNAGQNAPNPLEKATVEELDQVLTITLGAAMVLIQSFVPGMRRAKFGRIVNISSRAILGKSERVVYASAKTPFSFAQAASAEKFDQSLIESTPQTPVLQHSAGSKTWIAGRRLA